MYVGALRTPLAAVVYNTQGRQLHRSTRKKIFGKYYCDISLESSVSKYCGRTLLAAPDRPHVSTSRCRVLRQ
ncbi:hypothetical protein BN2475_250096 [Paraburkholderia ribeironis]|uniref:Uncharacterized protein n=1 Tax=Paraburkholderia ribeironis TaxID=1247936 RepID=A0A1N7RYS3_9BURK|nr:hypothetical protein BN2475_250096 [Paraburkholderia ribeironis]